MRKLILSGAVLWIATLATFAAQTPQRTSDARPAVTNPSTSPGTGRLAADDAALIKQFCVGCHNDRTKLGGLTLQSVDVASVGAHAEVLEKAIRKVKTGMMPPSGSPRPDRATLDAFAASLETRIDRAAIPGAALRTPALHRLNQAEYGNAIRDLLALDIDVTPLIPSDASSEGFDNIAEALGSSPSLIQGYVSAAMKISRLAVGDRTAPPSQVVYSAPAALAQDSHLDGMPLGTRGGIRFTHVFPFARIGMHAGANNFDGDQPIHANLPRPIDDTHAALP
jgi:hypothetical protein